VVRVLVVGASGAIGRELVPRFVSRGHDVVGTSTSEAGRARVEALGAGPAILDATDAEAVRSLVSRLRSQTVVVEVTSLSGPYERLDELTAQNASVRLEATLNVVRAAVDAGVRRLVVQSVAFWYAPGEGPATEDEQLRAAPAADAVRELEAAVLAAPLDGLVLRYGTFYGPGTWYARDGAFADVVRAGRHSIKDRGEDSLIQIADAAGATVFLAESGPPGVFNVVDDEPAPAREWVPAFAAAVGAPPPPVADASGPVGRGASNGRLRSVGWQPRWPTWRDGFREAL
jgi:nucleoside-diphosphate-sugar epimerase